MSQRGKNSEKILFDTHSTANLPPLAIFENSSFCSKKPIYFFKKKPNFKRFEKSQNFSRILQQNCYNLVMEKFQVREVFEVGHYN